MHLGVIGLGYWGSKLFGEYRWLRDEEFIDAVYAIDTDPTALDAVTDPDRTFSSIEDGLSELDAVHIATSNASHFPIAKTCLENGKDVLVEKPLTTDRERGFDLVETASENGSILQTGHIFRFADALREVRDRYQRGYFGEIEHVTLRWTHDFEPKVEDDVAWDLLPHPIDILNFVTSEWPQGFCGVANVDPESDHRTAVHTAFSLGDVNGLIQVSWADKDRKRLLEIAGTKRSATVRCVDQEIITTDGTEKRHIDVDSNNTIRAEAKNFVKASETGRNRFNSAIVGARTVDIIEQLIEALDDE
jgi:predicted dehydrogenase